MLEGGDEDARIAAAAAAGPPIIYKTKHLLDTGGQRHLTRLNQYSLQQVTSLCGLSTAQDPETG